jgi:hypothetical protein
LQHLLVQDVDAEAGAALALSLVVVFLFEAGGDNLLVIMEDYSGKNIKNELGKVV